MQTRLPDALTQTSAGREAEGILRACVHCGFCNATCPTYRLLGDELDGPRGRIYLIKSMLEGAPASDVTRHHLDRCLTCRACETTCPSGVAYGQLLDLGRDAVERQTRRPLAQRLERWMLRHVLRVPGRFRTALRLAHGLKQGLPARWRGALPRPAAPVTTRWPDARHARRMLVLGGCVQPVLAPTIDLAAAQVLDRLGISLLRVAQSGCCGALDYHLSAPADAAAAMRRTIDACWPLIEAGAEAIVQTASGCGVMVKDYGRVLRDDPVYAGKAARVSALARDIGEVLAAEPLEALTDLRPCRLAFHAPCTLQHGQRLGGVIEGILTRLGFELTPVPDAHLCCGAAGTYGFSQPELAGRLRAEKLRALEGAAPELIATANIGCCSHLELEAAVPVRHWIELLVGPGPTDA